MNGNRLEKALDKWWVKAEQKQFLYGTVGRVNADATVTIVVPQRPDFVYVLMTDSTLAQARNQRRVPLRAGLPVKLRRENGTLVILEEDRTGLLDNDPNAPGTVYSVNGQTGDVVLDTDDIAEGAANFYFTDERAQDAIGPILLDSSTIDFTYDDVTPTITGIVIDASIDNTKLATMAANTVKTNNTGSVAAPADVDATTFLGQYINGAAAKTTPVDADTMPLIDSEASNVLKKVSWANIKATLKTYLDTLYLVLLGKAGGQTAHGGTAASENLILDSTAHATKGVIALQPSGGQVGIGTVTPQVLVHLVSSAVAGATYNAGDPLTIERNASSNINIITGTTHNGGVIFSDAAARARGAFFYSHADDALIYWTTGTEKARITSVGNVGIGTAAPGVDVVGTTDITNTPLLQVDGATPRMVIRGSTDAGLNLIDTGAGANLKWMRLITDAGLTEFQSVDDSGAIKVDNILVLDHNAGQVMIGTATPVLGAELTVNGQVDISGVTTVLQLESSGWQSLGFGHHFYSDGGSPELMVLAENGRLGLGGAPVPSDMIHVNGTAVALRLGETNDYTRWSYVSAAQTLVESFRSAGDMLLDTNLHPGDGTGICTVRFFRNTNTTGQVRVQIYKGDGTGTSNIHLRGNGDTYINGNNGNVGVGLTATPGGKLHVSQPSTTAAIPALWLRQADLSEEMIRFETTVGAGNPVDTAALGTYYGKVRVHVEGVGAKMMALYNS